MSTHVQALSLVLAFVIVCVPGAGLALLLHPPGRSHWTVGAGLTFALGYAFIAVTAFALTLVHALTGAVFAIVVVALSAAIWAFVVPRIRAHGREIRRSFHEDGWLTHVPFFVLLGMALVVRASYGPLSNLMPTTLRYWTDGLEIADRGAFPTATYQWGRALPPTVSKVLFNTFNAGMSHVIGRAALPSTAVLLFFSSIALLCLGYGLAWALGFRRLAVLLPIALFFNGIVGDTELTADLGQNRAESWGRLVALGALILIVNAIRTRGTDGQRDRGRDAIAGGLLLGIAAGTHLVPVAVTLAMAVSYLAARSLVDHGSRGRVRLLAMAAGAAAVVAFVTLAASPGDIGFGGAGGDSGYAAINQRLGLPPTFDATDYLVFGDLDAASAGFAYGPADVVHDFLLRSWDVSPRVEAGPSGPKLVLPIAALLLGAIVLIVVGGSDRRAIAIASLLFAAILVAAGVMFALRYDLFVLETFGNRRLFNYVLVPFALIGVALGELALERLDRRTDRPRLVPVTAVVVNLVLGGALLATNVASPIRATTFRADAELIDWIGSHAGCQDRTLVDRRTLATFEGLVGRPAVLEGMGPHLRPDVLEVTLEELFAARDYFENPRAGKAYLDSRGVRYVVATRPGHPLGGWQRAFRGRLWLERVPYLTPVFTNEAGTVFEVRDPEPAAGLLDPATFPVYCDAT